VVLLSEPVGSACAASVSASGHVGLLIKQLLHAQPGLLRTAVLALLIGWVSSRGIHASEGEQTAGVATFSDILALEATKPLSRGGLRPGSFANHPAF
jgi:hypothetical protein